MLVDIATASGYPTLDALLGRPEWRPPANYAEPFSANIPALLISGRYDPATSDRFGEEVHRRYLPNSLHLVIGEAGHSARSPCTDSIARVFLDKASVTSLDTSCVSAREGGPVSHARAATGASELSRLQQANEHALPNVGDTGGREAMKNRSEGAMESNPIAPHAIESM